MATDYELVNAASQLEAGAKYVIGSADVTSAVFMGTKDNKNNRVQTPEVAITDGKITLTDTILVLELGGEADAWTFQTQNYHGTNGYLSNASSGTTNACFVQEAAMSFTIAFDGNKAVITSNGGNARNIMRYNSGSKCFACYASGQKDIYLYKEVASQGGEEPVVEPTTKTIYLNGGVSVTSVNLPENTVLLGAQTHESNYVDNVDTTGVGPRCTYLPADDALVVTTDLQRVTCYHLQEKKAYGTIPTTHDIYTLMTVGG